ncbi:MAG TPA: hypothetical protein VLB46_16710 [Pyrinomonadaceae bacterium]|nr:hypothetical protein [Pyrinomonadaceae bacterium]
MFRKIEVLTNLAIIITSIALCSVLAKKHLPTKYHFCTESAPFYQELQQKNPNDVALIAVFPQRVEETSG